MEEKKTNQIPEIKDEELDKVTGGRGSSGDLKTMKTQARSTWCSICGKEVNPEVRSDGDYCPDCGKRM